ncbi:unnamed protein product, partial [Porites evermanni]
RSAGYLFNYDHLHILYVVGPLSSGFKREPNTPHEGGREGGVSEIVRRCRCASLTIYPPRSFEQNSEYVGVKKNSSTVYYLHQNAPCRRYKENCEYVCSVLEQ